MYRLNNIKQNILIISSAALLVGCGGGSTTGDLNTAPIEKAVHTGQIKDSATGDGLENVKVSIGKSITITDTDGFYTLSGLTESEEAVVNFQKDGYFLGSTHIQVKSLSEDNTASLNYLEYSIHAQDEQWNYDSSEEIAGANISIDASVAYTDTEGKPYSGTIAAELTILDTTTDKGKTLFPGAFKGISTDREMVQFESYGLISISLKDSDDNTLSLADGEIATLVFKAISSTELQTTIPLWYYNYKQGQWIEEGYAELQEDGSYEGEISHLGTWSLNKSIEEDPGIYHGRIVDVDGLSLSEVRVHALGENWISSDLSTDADGNFEIEVIPGSSFQLKAYNYKDKYSATYVNTLPAISSGEVSENTI